MSSSDSWFVIPRPKPLAQVRLFCFPHAGGSVPTFHSWIPDLPEEIELCVIQLPGRGARFRERPYVQMADLIEKLAELILPKLDKTYSFFGHSLGALISFELARNLRDTTEEQPSTLFVSSCKGPNLLPENPGIHDLPDKSFIAEIERYKGTPAAVLDNQELLTLMLPILRADFALIDSYRYVDDLPLSCPIVAIGGRDDELIDLKSLSEWQNQTTGRFTLNLLPGDHFYINNSRQSLLEVLRDSLLRYS